MSSAAAAIATSRVLRRQRELAAHFASAGATSPERAASLSDLGLTADATFERLVTGGVIIRANGDRWYLDHAMWGQFTARQRTRLLIAATVIILGATVFMALWLAR